MSKPTSHLTSQRVAVVTGSSSGIGQATAIKLAEQGHAICLHASQNLTGLSETAKAIRARHPAADLLAVTADIRCPKSCRQFVETAFAWRGSVDAWINNAGADVLTGNAANLSFEDRLQHLLAVDVCGTIRISRLVADRMSATNTSEKCSPTIINIGWDQAWLGMEGEPGLLFGTCKSAVEAFTKSLALTVAPRIRVNCVAPGWIQTAWGAQHASSSWAKRAIAESLMQRWGMPDDVGRCIAWLCSHDAQFVNGQTINVNGGRRYFV